MPNYTVFRFDGTIQVRCFHCDSDTSHRLYLVNRWTKLWVCTECGLQEEHRALNGPDPSLDALSRLVYKTIDTIQWPGN